MNQQLSLPEEAIAPVRGEGKRSDELLDDLACRRAKVVNVALVGNRAMHGPEMRAALHTLARDFDRVARPA